MFRNQSTLSFILLSILSPDNLFSVNTRPMLISQIVFDHSPCLILIYPVPFTSERINILTVGSSNPFPMFNLRSDDFPGANHQVAHIKITCRLPSMVNYCQLSICLKYFHRSRPPPPMRAHCTYLHQDSSHHL